MTPDRPLRFAAAVSPGTSAGATPACAAPRPGAAPPLSGVAMAPTGAARALAAEADPGLGDGTAGASVSGVAGPARPGAAPAVGPGGARPGGARRGFARSGCAGSGGAQAGFTLLEILVALVVLGMLIATLAQGTRFGVGALAVQARIVAVRGDEDAVERAVRRMIEHMDPGTFSTPPDMAGTLHHLEFVTDLPVAASALQSLRVDAALDVDRQHRLLLRWRPHVGGLRLAPPPPLSEEVLLSGVDQVSFGFLASGRGWQENWRGTELPLLVRMHLGFAKGDKRSWPDLVGAPRRQRPDQ